MALKIFYGILVPSPFSYFQNDTSTKFAFLCSANGVSWQIKMRSLREPVEAAKVKVRGVLEPLDGGQTLEFHRQKNARLSRQKVPLISRLRLCRAIRHPEKYTCALAERDFTTHSITSATLQICESCFKFAEIFCSSFVLPPHFELMFALS